MKSNLIAMVPERENIALAQSGNSEAFAHLVRAYEGRMLRTALRVLRDEQDAEDAVQQAFTAAWGNLSKFRGDSAFSTWLTRITINESLSIVRRRKQEFVELDEKKHDRSESMESASAPTAPCPEKQLLKSELHALVRESMKEVKPAYRKAMRLRILEDLSVDEISRRLSLPVNTVKVHLFRGRKAMKSYLAPRLGIAA